MLTNARLLTAALGIFVSVQMAVPATASISKAKQDLPHLVVVDANLMRGAQPSEAGLKTLRERGIKTIINLRHNNTTVKEEEIAAEKLGLNYVSIPLDGIRKPSEAAIKKFLQVTQDPTEQPVFVHCEFGQDRTGAMVAIYREEAYNWKADAAYKEALSNGFHPAYYWLTDSVFAYEESKGLQHSTSRPLAVKVMDSFEQALRFWKPKKVASRTATPIVATQSTPTPKT